MDVPSVLAECDDRREYRDDLLHGTLAVISSTAMGYGTVTDKDIESAVSLADRLIRKVDKFVSGPTTLPVPPVVLPTVKAVRCHSHKDGDCTWSACPQLRDNEPAMTGRHCPLDDGEDGYE